MGSFRGLRFLQIVLQNGQNLVKWKLNLKIKYMQKKRSVSQTSKKKNFKKKITALKKSICFVCQPKCDMIILTQKSLYKKYSYHHLSEPVVIDKCITDKKPRSVQMIKQFMQKYYKSMQRKHEFPRIKQVYKHHQETPRLFMSGIRQIISKCYHRKRLLEYFKIAKILGIRVDTVKFSTFMLSISKTQQEGQKRKIGYNPMIGQISGYEFSQDVQRQLIQILSNQQGQKITNPEHEQGEEFKNKDRETTCSFNNLKYRF